MIYSLDFLSSALYFSAAIILHTGYFNFPVFAAACFLMGSIESIYIVAYESFYPLLITPGNYSRAYSIAGILETFVAEMIPVSAFLYGIFGIVPLLFISSICFFTAAAMETRSVPCPHCMTADTFSPRIEYQSIKKTAEQKSTAVFNYCL